MTSSVTREEILELLRGSVSKTPLTWDDERLTKALQSLYESYYEGVGDFCGEQREYHLPRLREAAFFFINLFPKQGAAAIMRAGKSNE